MKKRLKTTVLESNSNHRDSIKHLALSNVVCELNSLMYVNTMCLTEKNS